MQKDIQNKRLKGQIGEQLAAKYLQRQGLEIIEHNYFQRSGEIDIIATENNEIVFVEVKTLNSEVLLQITDTISSLKKNRLMKLAKVWLCKHNLSEAKYRIDFFGLVYRNSKIKKLVHIKNAIY
jgi:putative endonuclease